MKNPHFGPVGKATPGDTIRAFSSACYFWRRPPADRLSPCHGSTCATSQAMHHRSIKPKLAEDQTHRSPGRETHDTQASYDDRDPVAAVYERYNTSSKHNQTIRSKLLQDVMPLVCCRVVSSRSVYFSLHLEHPWRVRSFYAEYRYE